MIFFRTIAVIFAVLLCSCTSESAETESSDQISEDLVELSDSSEITCPNCGFIAMEKLPDEYCLISYDCKRCGKTMHPDEGDCCVFCTYGSHKCPSMQ